MFDKSVYDEFMVQEIKDVDDSISYWDTNFHLFVLSYRDEGIVMYEVDSESKDAEASIFNA